MSGYKCLFLSGYKCLFLSEYSDGVNSGCHDPTRVKYQLHWVLTVPIFSTVLGLYPVYVPWTVLQQTYRNHVNISFIRGFGTMITSACSTELKSSFILRIKDNIKIISYLLFCAINFSVVGLRLTCFHLEVFVSKYQIWFFFRYAERGWGYGRESKHKSYKKEVIIQQWLDLLSPC